MISLSLPDIFDNFRNLQKASFEKNDLTQLPPSFGELSKLETLDLSENNLVIFPQVLFELQLRILNIERNRIQIIIEAGSDEEKAISFFRNLSHLQMRNNPFIVGKQLDSKKGSLIALQNEKLKRSRSLRVNVLGNSGAGKSSLVQAFTIQKYVVPTTKTEHRHTVGIERHFLPLDINGKTVVLHIWDYAGDDEYAMMNDLFITDGSLVWLVVNLDKYKWMDDSDNDENVFYKNVGDWLLLIMSHNKNPNVWIICTHRDMCSKALANKNIQQIKQYIKSLCQGEEKKSIALIKNVKYINLTNTFSFMGIDKIHEELENLSDSTLHLETPLTVQWIKWMDHIQNDAEVKLSKFESPVLLNNELAHLLKGSLCNLRKFLDYHRDVGEIYEIDADNYAEKMVVLSPKWLISLLKLVYRHDFEMYFKRVKSQSQFHAIYPKEIIDDALKKRESGMISKPVLKALWKCHQNEFNNVIKLFLKFNLTIPSPDEQYFNCTVQFYYFPYCLKNKQKIEGKKRNEKLASYNSIIVLKCLLPRIKVKLFLERLALKLSEDEHPDIYADGFETTIKKDIKLLVLRVTRNHSDDIQIQFYSNINMDLLWADAQKKLQDIYDFLLICSTILSDRAQLEVSLTCLCNYFPLMEIIEDVYENVCPKYHLKCRECNFFTPINRVAAKSTLEILKTFGHDNNSPPISNEKEFIKSFGGNKKFELTPRMLEEEKTLLSFAGSIGDTFPPPIEERGAKT